MSETTDMQVCEDYSPVVRGEAYGLPSLELKYWKESDLERAMDLATQLAKVEKVVKQEIKLRIERGDSQEVAGYHLAKGKRTREYVIDDWQALEPLLEAFPRGEVARALKLSIPKLEKALSELFFDTNAIERVLTPRITFEQGEPTLRKVPK